MASLGTSMLYCNIIVFGFSPVYNSNTVRVSKNKNVYNLSFQNCLFLFFGFLVISKCICSVFYIIAETTKVLTNQKSVFDLFHTNKLMCRSI